jgi:hypothetical protein
MGRLETMRPWTRRYAAKVIQSESPNDSGAVAQPNFMAITDAGPDDLRYNGTREFIERRSR